MGRRIKDGDPKGPPKPSDLVILPDGSAAIDAGHDGPIYDHLAPVLEKRPGKARKPPLKAVK